MFSKPICYNMSEKVKDIALISLVTLMYIALCAEADMYVPSFPQMIKYFGIEENKIQLVLSINFAGLCIAGLIAGPLSDSYGRRKLLVWGLLLFVISSLGCVLVDNFELMLFWRLLQGLAASVPMVVAGAMFFDKYTAQKAGQLVGVINSVISASMAGAPIIGAWISQIFNWRANFIVILVLAIVTFIGTIFFIEETLAEERRKSFSLVGICKDYFKLSKSLKFMGYSLIVNFSFIAIVVYISNLSVIFINHMNMDLKEFSYYQASTMGTFIIFALFSIKLIGKKGIDYTKNLGSVLAFIGAIGMFYVSQAAESNVNFICVSMAFIAAGGAMMAGTFGMKALEVFPGMNGTAMAMMTAVRQLLASGLVILSEIYFDGTIVPVALIISAYGAVSVIFYIVIFLNDKNKSIIKA
ncbi:MAG: multidrug effflux MFS transporter [Alphaproteobacteria bacterium]